MTADEIELPAPDPEPAQPAPGVQQPAPTAEDAVGVEPAPPGEVPPSSALVARPGPAAGTGLITPEVRQLAVQMAEELFRPWELALREQFDAEIAQRLESELEHQERQAESLAAELADRRVMFEGTWTSAHPRGSTTDTVKWEMEQTIRRQAAELEENEVDLVKLKGWLERIRGRDVFGANGMRQAVEALSRCESTLEDYAARVYSEEGEGSSPYGAD